MHCFLTAMRQEPDSDGVRRTRFGVLRASYPALKSTVILSWKSWFKKAITIVYDTPIRGMVEMSLDDGTKLEMELVFIALDREDDVNKLQSLELTGAHVNEAAEVPEGVIQMLKTRIRRYPAAIDGGPTHSFIICDYNSVDIDHYLYILAEEKKPAKHSFYVQPPAMLRPDPTVDKYVLNPEAENLGHHEAGDPNIPPVKSAVWDPVAVMWWIPHLPEGYYEDMVEGNDEDFITVFILNEYGAVRKGRPVYKAYRDKIHCVSNPLSPIKAIPLIIGVDVGLTPAAAFTQLSPTGTLNVLDEIVTENTSIIEFAENMLWPLLRSKYAGYNFKLVLDPAARARSQNDKKSAYDIFVGAGLSCVCAHTNDPLARREAVNYFLLRMEGFALDPSCNMLRKGFISEYHYERVASSLAARFKDQPAKNIFSHVHDGLQYACLHLTQGVRRRRLPNGSGGGLHVRRGPADTNAGY